MPSKAVIPHGSLVPRVFAAFLIAFGLLFSAVACGCSGGDPVQIVNANFFMYTAGGYGHSSKPYLFVDWQNKSRTAVEYVEVTVKLYDEDGRQLPEVGRDWNGAESYGEDTFTIRLMQMPGVEPGVKNLENLNEVDLKFDAEPDKLAIRVDRVGFADGTTWENADENGGFQEFATHMDASSEIPVAIDEVNFYQTSANATDRYLNIDWHNRSSDVTVYAVEFKITGHVAHGVTSETDPVVYLTHSDYVDPGYENHIWKSQFSNYFSGHINDAIEYEICVNRVIDVEGNVWVNESGSGSITATYCGKKGCSFGDYSQYPQIAKLVERIHSSLAAAGIEMSEPEVFVKPGSHAVIRYPDLDITVKLDDADRVSDDWVSINLYFEDNERNWEILQPRYEAVGVGVLPAVLTSMPSDDLAECWVEYCRTDADSPVFPDASFKIEENTTNVYKDFNKKTLFGMLQVCVARDTSDAFDHDWAKYYPY